MLLADQFVERARAHADGEGGVGGRTLRLRGRSVAGIEELVGHCGR
jgi:hypothetical protein